MRNTSNRIIGLLAAYDTEVGLGRHLPALIKAKQLQAAAEELADKLTRSRINAEFRKLRAEQPEGVLKLDGAELGAYSYPKKYKYPQAVLDAEAEWKRLKAVAEADGTATPVKRTEDPDNDTLFTVKLLRGGKP